MMIEEGQAHPISISQDLRSNFATFGTDFVHSATTKFKYHNSSFRTARFYETQGKGLEARVMNQLKTCGYMMKQTGNTLKKFH